VPDIVGTYYLQTHFPAQWYNTTYTDWYGNEISFSEYYEASESEKLKLIVQEEPTPNYPGQPLPAEYWTRPIDAQAREWYTIAGSWPYTPDNRFAPYNDGPETAHILWTKPLTIGGLVGGDVGLNVSINQGPAGFGIGDAYEGKWGSRFILAGRLYYTEITSEDMYAPCSEIYHCVDLRTGDEYWAKTFLDNRSIAFGQLLYWQTMNYMGTFAYLWVVTGGYDWYSGEFLPETWYAFDAYTGDWVFTIENMPLGTTLIDAYGKLYRLQVDTANGWMALWNMTALCIGGLGPVDAASWGYNVQKRTFDAAENTTVAKDAWSWNKTIPTDLPGSVQYPATPFFGSSAVPTYFGDRIIGSNLYGGFEGGFVPENVVVWGLSLKKGREGTLLFNTTWTPPKDWIAGNQSISWAAWSLKDKVGVLWSKEVRAHYGVSLETGDLIWGPTPSQYYLDCWEGSQLTSHLIAYGKLYACGVSGIVYCYNVTTGELLWTYEAKDPYHEFLFGNNWQLGIVFITDGKVYVGHGEHSPNQPLPRGAPFICLNATTGDVIWRINGAFRQTGWGGLAIIGDSTIATMDTYDQRVYAIGRGPTAAEVSATPKVLANGDSVLIEGTVMDVSPGTKEYALTARFPNGVPAVADENMSEWMLYVYKQFSAPTDVTGVPVLLQAMSSNGTIIDIGWVTSDGAGYFSCKWTPPDEDVYTIMATFPGSKSYWPSYAQTALGVTATPTPAPQAATPEEVQEDIDRSINSLTPMFLGIIVAVAIAIIIGILNLWAIRKQRK
jgi:outer membrane protein assembly factor BamB